MKIGVLDIQGSVEEHFAVLGRIDGVEPVLVKRVENFSGLGGLIIPGGESTTISKLLREYGLDREIRAFAKRGGKIFGTCAGAILLAKKIIGEACDVEPLGLIDIDVDRNAYGRQLDSFEGSVKFNGEEIPAIFIRAPKISRAGEKCEVLARLEGEPVLVREGNVLISTFHPEMDEDLSVYKYFFGL